MPADAPRLLIVVSQDYGELSNALQFTRGRQLRASLLLPETLLGANREGLPLPAERYAGVQDVLDTVRRATPDLVCLFSAYLYAANGLFDLAALEALLAALGRRGTPVVTTDPFLGLMQQPGPLPFSEQHPARAWLQQHFGAVARLLAPVTHLYHAPPDPAPPVQWLSFFNPAMLSSETAAAAHAATLASMPGVDRTRGHWLFVLAQEDYGAQAGARRRAQFESLLLDRLADADAAGRQPVLIAPRACVEALAATGRVPEGALLLPFCGQARFEALLMRAEHVFYWNLFSNSAPGRLLNRLPALFFDVGHMARAVPPLHALGLRSYYPGAVLDPIDLHSALQPAALAQRAARQAETLAAARQRCFEQPGPESVVGRLIGRRA